MILGHLAFILQHLKYIRFVMIYMDYIPAAKEEIMSKPGYIYIMTNKNRTTLYIGVTNDLCRRIYEHKNHFTKDSFTDKYNLEYCIYYEEFPYFDLAINREKELKKWNHQKKEYLINKVNPEWKELVSEHGFVRIKVSFSDQVKKLVKEIQQKNEIPSFDKLEPGDSSTNEDRRSS